MPPSQTCREGRYVQERSLQYGYKHSRNDSYIPGSLNSNWNVGAMIFKMQTYIKSLTFVFEFMLSCFLNVIQI